MEALPKRPHRPYLDTHRKGIPNRTKFWKPTKEFRYIYRSIRSANASYLLLPLLELAAAEHAVLPMLAMLELAVAVLPVLELAAVVASVAAVADPIATMAHHASPHVPTPHVTTVATT